MTRVVPEIPTETTEPAATPTEEEKKPKKDEAHQSGLMHELFCGLAVLIGTEFGHDIIMTNFEFPNWAGKNKTKKIASGIIFHIEIQNFCISAFFITLI